MDFNALVVQNSKYVVSVAYDLTRLLSLRVCTISYRIDVLDTVFHGCLGQTSGKTWPLATWTEKES